MENNLFKSGVLLFALGSMSCISLWAQGTVEDYNRAYALREKYNAKLVHYFSFLAKRILISRFAM